MTFINTQNLSGHSSEINCIAMINLKLMVSGSNDKTLKTWDLKSGNVIKTLIGHLDCVLCVAVVTPNLIVSGPEDARKKMIFAAPMPSALGHSTCQTAGRLTYERNHGGQLCDLLRRGPVRQK